MSSVLILIIGLWLIKLIRKLVSKILQKRDFDISVRSFLEKILSGGLKILLFIIVVSRLGVQTTSFVAMIGAAGLAIGLALQGSLANFAGGVLILIFKPFKVGDYIASASGPEGTVTSIDIFHTKLTTAQNQMIVVPNGHLSNSDITNYSKYDTRRTWFDIKVPYDTDLKRVKEILLNVAINHPLSLKDPAPQIFVSALGESSVNVSVRVSAKSSDYWTMIEEVMIACKVNLEKEGISAAYPQRGVHILHQPES